MKVLFYGDSITDAGRNYELMHGSDSYGNGYVKYVVEELLKKGFTEEDFLNRGISGNRSVDLYARIKGDCWNHKPDVVSILVGINDVWPFEFEGNGVELNRYEKVYRMMIEDTKAKLPNVQMILCEPFMLVETAYENDRIKWTSDEGIREYAAIVKKLAKEYGLPFVALQDKLLQKAAENGTEYYSCDGIHPTPAGAKLIANEWLKVFEQEIKK